MLDASGVAQRRHSRFRIAGTRVDDMGSEKLQQVILSPALGAWILSHYVQAAVGGLLSWNTPRVIPASMYRCMYLYLASTPSITRRASITVPRQQHLPVHALIGATLSINRFCRQTTRDSVSLPISSYRGLLLQPWPSGLPLSASAPPLIPAVSSLPPIYSQLQLSSLLPLRMVG